MYSVDAGWSSIDINYVQLIDGVFEFNYALTDFLPAALVYSLTSHTLPWARLQQKECLLPYTVVTGAERQGNHLAPGKVFKEWVTLAQWPGLGCFSFCRKQCEAKTLADYSSPLPARSRGDNLPGIPSAKLSTQARITGHLIATDIMRNNKQWNF